MTNVKHEINSFKLKLAKATYDLNEDFKKLSPVAQQEIEKEAQYLLKNFSFENVLSHLCGQAQQ